jgi:hypothetical protein
MYSDFSHVLKSAGLSANGNHFTASMGAGANGGIFDRIPNRHDAAEEINAATSTLPYLNDAYDWLVETPTNTTAREQLITSTNSLITARNKTKFESFDVNLLKVFMYNAAESEAEIESTKVFYKYIGFFRLILSILLLWVNQ